MTVRTLSDAKKRINHLSNPAPKVGASTPGSDAYRENFDNIKWPDRSSTGCAEDCSHPEHGAGVHIPSHDETRVCGDCREFKSHTGNDAHGVCDRSGTNLPWYNITCVKFRSRAMSAAFLGE